MSGHGAIVAFFGAWNKNYNNLGGGMKDEPAWRGRQLLDTFLLPDMVHVVLLPRSPHTCNIAVCFRSFPAFLTHAKKFIVLASIRAHFTISCLILIYVVSLPPLTSSFIQAAR